MIIRPYEAADLGACRRLYAQLVQHHRDIYDDQSIGGEDPGRGFDDYLALPGRVATWVAVDEDVIVGLTGLLWEDGESTVEPVVVDRERRGAGIGRRLLQTAIEESRHRGAVDVNIKPVARNESAIRAFHELGFRTLGHIQLFMRFEPDGQAWKDGVEIHGARFDY